VNKAASVQRRPALRRFKPYPNYKESGVEWLGEIPAHWDVKRLKRIVQFLGGGTPSKANVEYWRGDIPWVSPKDMKVSVVIETEDKITPEAVHESATKFVPAGAVLIVVRSGILVHSIPVALAGREVTLNQDVKALIPTSEIAPEYLMYLIWGMQRELLVEWKKEGATVESLELDLVADTPTPLPFLPEQRAIAAFLDRETARIDALVAKNERLIELLQEQRTALITRAVTKGLDPNVPLKDSGVEWLGEIPTHWESRPLKVQCDIRGRIGYRGYAVDDIVPEGQGAITLSPGNIREDGLDLSECTYLSWDKYRESPEIQIEPRDIILTKTGSTLGKGAIVARCDEPMTINPQLVILRHREVTSAEFLAYILRCDGMKDLYWLENSGGATPTVSQQKVGKFSVPVPPLREQGGIAHFLDREILKIDALIANVRDVINRLKELRTALICAAVTGKVDVREEVA